MEIIIDNNGITLNESGFSVKRPPLGITPRFILDEERREEIIDAMNRYLYKNKRIPSEWLEELNEIQDRLSKKENNFGSCNFGFINKCVNSKPY
ncbi:hypothetical protein CNEO4_620037 [Clostridium neonatale]|uniref:hypothetical protein n=1 Tax=Clostridium neonatale TaxID=137838 RepID=UPI00291BCCE6|nr:hypothetical protein [Clostridium neonatale]CAI3674294.1 hypothetical protein CNEO4_620037 [Clostridium neonatale]